ncbi:isomerase [Spartobacteria bacterium LR76]|nr:isomerase [Spartobacteria bacterium LR76]
MKVPYFHVDAFASEMFRGNPAGVCLLREAVDDATLQRIAFENNLSETAFVLPQAEEFSIRWFTPTVEVDLCGHATLAAAHVLVTEARCHAPIRFDSASGVLGVSAEGDRLVLDFPARSGEVIAETGPLAAALGAAPREVRKAQDFLCIYDRAEDVLDLRPDMAAVAGLDARGVIATAPGEDCDFVSRFFAPGCGIPEDPVTGSAHCTLAPYWAERLGKNVFFARQVSARGGELWCELAGDRVRIGGRCVTYLRGEISV